MSADKKFDSRAKFYLDLTMKHKFSVIAAMTKLDRGIGFRNELPWSGTDIAKKDMKFFATKTTSNTSPHEKNVVIMGRNTWNSLPSKFKPLPKRTNIVVSKTLAVSPLEFPPRNDTLFEPNLERALHSAFKTGSELRADNVFVIGGQKLYEEALLHPGCENIYLTEIHKKFECDTFFPEIPSKFQKVSQNDELNLSFLKYSANSKMTSSANNDVEKGESDYLDLLNDILEDGESRIDRTGVGTRSLFGKHLKFSLKNNTIPLLTTKKVYFKGVVEELLFFLRGDHDNRKLRAKGVSIWDGNTSREYLDGSGKNHIETNDLGVAYGVQWRSYGCKLEYDGADTTSVERGRSNIDANYNGKGIDQVADVIDQIRNNPNSRRMLINAWNPTAFDDMALHPCHYSYQFYVSGGPEEGKKYLSCMMTQRSADAFLGLPFNIASTATLTHIFAKLVGMEAKEIILNLGDVHLYNNHIEQAKTQIIRTPFTFPTLRITKELKTLSDVEGLQFEDFDLTSYKYHPAIKAKMAI